MHKALKTLLTIIFLSALFTISAVATETTSINSLIDKSLLLNNTTVTVEGEAIGEVLERGDYAWVNISDGTNAIGIWLKMSDAEKVKHFGDFKHIGDTIRITGTFSSNCSEHGGDVDIHCNSFELVKAGHAVKDEVSNTKLITAAILFCLALIVGFICRKIVRKEIK